MSSVFRKVPVDLPHEKWTVKTAFSVSEIWEQDDYGTAEHGILAYYDAQITTGPLEGLNNKIKTMKRQS